MSKSKRRAAISDLLRQTIIESGMTLLVLERETGVKRASIRAFVESRQFLRLDMADRLAEYFGLKLVQERKTK
jgi:plasmid maintenance system antidote protein VapI